MRRTQIYLDEDQKKSLRVLAAELDANMSDLVRRAIDQMLRDESQATDPRARLRNLRERMRADLNGGATDEAIAVAVRRVRSQVAKKQRDRAKSNA